MTDLATLRRLAEAATPGPWSVEPGEWSPDVLAAQGEVLVTTQHSDLSRMQDASNAAYIAAANPATVLALLDRLAAAEAVVEAAELLLGGCGEILTRVRTYDDPAEYAPTHEECHERDLRAAVTAWKEASK